MWDAGWAGDIAWFQFGEAVARRDRASKERAVGQYAVHISCAWRWLAASGFVRAEDTSPSPLLHALGELRARVAGATVAGDGELALRFDNGDTLLIEGAASAEAGSDEVEYWRLFQPGRGTPHLVVSSAGVEWHEA